MTTNYVARNQYKAYRIYSELAKIEWVPEFKRILESLAKHEQRDFEFWLGHAQQKDFKVSWTKIILFKLLRRTFGLTFTTKFLERHEKEMIRRYQEFLKTIKDKELKKQVQKVIQHEQKHEHTLISQIREERVLFISSIILGLNDGLIEITGALVGFAFALGSNALVATAGTITGLAASLSMASSAYMQAQYEEGKNAIKVALYTGVTYLVVVGLLISPFLLSTTISSALAGLLSIIIFIISSISYYTSIIFERSFKKQFFKMLVFSLGVAAITFAIGQALKYFLT